MSNNNYMTYKYVEIKKVHPDAIIPNRGSEQAAGVDLYACISEPVFIPPHKTVMVGSGVAIKLPYGMFGGLFARSGIATKRGLRPATGTSVIDSDYVGEIMVPIHNDCDTYKAIEPKERIAQLVILPYVAPVFKVVDELEDTERGSGGFGSTGK